MSFTENQKLILLQQATRGCTAACVAMLILENLNTLSEQHMLELSRTNLGDRLSMCRLLQKAGLTPVVKYDIPLDCLQQTIQENGPAIASIRGHVVIVDEVTESFVRIRDLITDGKLM
ncbi:MAG TPA: hypothetical protein DCE71_08755 [Parachlamydiales bacterium]|nr:hypothetical protein [Parachlamydiales bacterium]